MPRPDRGPQPLLDRVRGAGPLPALPGHQLLQLRRPAEAVPPRRAPRLHPQGVRPRRRPHAVISGKYGGGVFCNLPDGTVCMCSYSYQHEDSDFRVGDTVILLVQRYDVEKRQMYGKILSKW